ncbi:MAG: hypothetical protein ACE141_18810 [Bryobacteraceae bacterium]
MIDHGKGAQETRQTIAYAVNGSTDKKTIEIPDPYVYISHSTRRTTANPEQNPPCDDWSYKDGVVRLEPSGRIIQVWVECSAMSQSWFGPGHWIGIELTVTIERTRPLTPEEEELAKQKPKEIVVHIDGKEVGKAVSAPERR